MYRTLRHLTFVLLLLNCGSSLLWGQQFPGEDENIPYLITFGKEGETSWGDDDFSQTFFIGVPRTHRDPIYIRVFDPDVGGEIDEVKGAFNTHFKFSIYGGTAAYSNLEAQGYNPEGSYDSGTLLASKTFAVNPKYDAQWYTFGPFNPSEGEEDMNLDKYVFKVIAEGISGDDGNLYKYFVSTQPNRNTPIEGANAFTYEYTFRMPNEPSICHIYPYIDDQVVSVKQYNFDWDGDGLIRIVSTARKGDHVNMSTDDNWAISKHKVSEREKNTSLDVQLLKTNNVNNNNVVVRITNQHGEALPFFSIPIGGRPSYKPQVEVKPLN